MTSPFSRIAFILVASWLGNCGEVGAQTADELLKKGEVFDEKYEPGEALKFYLAADKLEPQSVRIMIRIARQYRHMMVGTSSKEEKVRFGRLALTYAKPAAALAPNDAEAQLAVAITLGKLMPLLTSKEQVETSPRLRTAVDKTLRLDARSDTAWHILGRWHRTLAEISGVKRALAGVVYGGLPKGSYEEAAKCLETAIAINPNRLMHSIELGRVYARLGRKEDARRFLAKGLAMPNVEIDDPETKERGREELKKLR